MTVAAAAASSGGRAAATKGAASSGAAKGATSAKGSSTRPTSTRPSSSSSSSSSTKDGGGRKRGAADDSPLLPAPVRRGAGKAARAWGGNARRLLVAEFLLCVVIVAFSPLGEKHREEGASAWMKRMSAVMGVFFVLGLISTAGRGASRVSAAFGGLVTLGLLVSSRSVFVTLAKKFNAGDGPDSGTGDDTMPPPENVPELDD